MCGIIGYIGSKDAYPVLINGLKRLEYRGYDSSGVSLITNQPHEIVTRKTFGKIRNLEDQVEQQPIPVSHLGISHTRWATHGIPNQVNAHPHSDAQSQFTLVHNGIIENYESLKQYLIKKGCVFVSDTDTEVIVHLIADHYEGDLKKAVMKTVAELEGAFALGVISALHPDQMIAARLGSPLVIGVGEEEFYIASDVPAIIEYTKDVIYLKDGEMAVLKPSGADVTDFTGNPAPFEIQHVDMAVDQVQKQGYPHFMLKEIHEQPDVLRRMISTRVVDGVIRFDELNLTNEQIKSFRNIVIVACGTAYHAGLVGRYAIESMAGLPVQVDVSSEFRYREPLVDEGTLIIAISQSGETADTLAATREAAKRGACVITVCNVIGSSLVREADGVLYTHAGPEIGVASTKAYTAQLNILYLFAIHLGRIFGHLANAEYDRLLNEITRVPDLYTQVLGDMQHIEDIARYNSHFGCFLFLGRHINFPTALEGALKLKEISYVPAEGYAAGEMKHGPIALIDEYRAVVCIAPKSRIYEKMISNIQEIRSRKGKIIAIATEGDEVLDKHASHVIYVPETEHIFSPLMVVLPLQILAYYIAVNRGCDVDQPRNLAKSVTVE